MTNYSIPEKYTNIENEKTGSKICLKLKSNKIFVEESEKFKKFVDENEIMLL